MGEVLGRKYSFTPGLELNRGFYIDIVKPLLENAYQGLEYSAALIGYGSDVLGLDDDTSMDIAGTGGHRGRGREPRLPPPRRDLARRRIAALVADPLGARGRVTW